MKTKLILALVPILASAMHAEESKYQPINPALLYWQAAAVLPKLSDAQAAELRDMANGILAVDPAKIESLGLGPTEGLLRRAVASPATCDWGLVLEEGPELVLPHLSKLQEMANIARVQGEVLLAQGKTDEGLDWFIAAHRIARHSGAGGVLLSYLVQAGIESSVLQAAARHCLAWDEATRRGYAAKLKALPPLHTLQEGFRGDLIFADWLERLERMEDAQRREKIQMLVATASEGGKTPPDQAEQMEKLRSLTNPETLRSELKVLRGFHQRTDAAFGKSWKDAQPELAAIENDLVRSPSFLVKIAFPATLKIQDKEAALATRRIMLELALQHGRQLDEAAVSLTHDAFEGQPLRLKKAEDGTISLVAAVQHPKGKDIELKLGK